MNPLVEREGFRIVTTVPQKKKTKEKKAKSKGVEHVQIIDDDAPIPWNPVSATAITTSTKTKSKTKPNQLESMINDEIISAEDAPVIVGIIDERPKDVREKERFKDVKRWRTAAFEQVPEPGSIGPRLKPTKSSRQKQDGSDDSDPDLDRGRSAKSQDPDLSPPRKRRTQQEDDDPSPPRRRPQTADDPSPSRRKRDNASPPRRRRQSDDDPSLPRIKREGSSPPRRKHKHKHDSSPPRRREKSSSPPSRKRHTKDDDSSPPRHRDKSSTSSTRDRRPKQESPPPSIQPAKSERRRLAEHKEQITERYAQWGRGLAQVRQAEETVKDYIELAEKPLARYRDDQDLDSMLKQKEREDDPMLKYLTKNSSDTGDRTGNPNQPPPKPRYKGPEPQKNRFNIWPGYRWDGVDRSNGYEKKLFESIANRHAKSQEAYLWSVEDM